MHIQNAVVEIRTPSIYTPFVALYYRLDLLWRLAELLAAKDSTSRLLLTDARCLCLPGLLASSLLSLLDVSSAGTAAAQTGLDQPGENRCACCNPHEHEHLDAQRCADIELLDRGGCVLHDDKHDGRDDSSDGGEQGEPAGEDGQGVQNHHDEGQAGARKEETEHPVRHSFDQTEDIGKFGG
jgi:hypothetical protein